MGKFLPFQMANTFDMIEKTSSCLVVCAKFRFVFISGHYEKSHQKIVKMGTIFRIKIFLFGTAKTKCQQRLQVFQWIFTNWNIAEMLKKVWFEKARELTFQSYLKSASLVKKSMKICFFHFFSKKAFTSGQISPTF